MRALCNIRPKKTETHITILAAGGNIIDYSGEVSTARSELTTMKIHVSSAISDTKSTYMCMDIKYFYLNNYMDKSEYIMRKLSMIPQESVEK